MPVEPAIPERRVARAPHCGLMPEPDRWERAAVMKSQGARLEVSGILQVASYGPLVQLTAAAPLELSPIFLSVQSALGRRYCGPGYPG